MYVCIFLYFCVFEFLGVIRVRCSVKALSHSNSLSQYVTTSMNDLVGPGRTGRTFVSACAQLWCWSSSLILRDVIISLSYPVTTYQWRCSVIDYLGVYWWTISLTLDEQTVRLYPHVLDLNAVVCVWASMWSQSPHHLLAKYTTMAMIGVPLTRLSRP